jgi:hypothetical protein
MNFGKSLRALKVALPLITLGSACLLSPSSVKAQNIISAVGGSGSCAEGNTSDTTFTFSALSAALAGGASGLCYNDDKLYTFTSATTPGFLPTDQFSIQENGLAHTLNVQATGELFTPADPGGINVGTYELDYTVAIIAPSDLVFDTFTTAATSSNLGPNTWEKTLTEATFGTITATNLSPGGSSPTEPLFPPDSTLVSFKSILKVEGTSLDQGVTQFTDTVRQRRAATPTPAPLPIFGAGIAFGFSRSLRKRIASSRIS